MTDHTFAGLEASIRTMSDADVRKAVNEAEGDSEKCDLLSDEMERRNLDD